MTEEAESSAPAREVVISGEALAWGAATLLFLGLRLGTIWHGPVGGTELVHLSGAWQARVGVSDDRYVPTLFQALAQLLFHASSSAAWPRLLAFLASATIPAAIYLLRPRLGNGGALLALVLLSLEPVLIDASTSASAMAFDFAIALWLFVLVTRPGSAPWLWGVMGFLVATGGPLPMVLAAAWAGVAVARRRYPPWEHSLYAGAGVAVGVLAATLRFGLGASDGVRVPPFDLFAASFGQAWSSPTTMELAVLYSSPLIIAGLAAAAVALARMVEARDAAMDGLVLLGWTALAVLWVLASSKSHSAAPLVALAVPLALILGPALVEVIGAMWRADWRLARFLVPAAIVAALVAVSFSLDWARDLRVGDTGEKLLVGGLLVAAVSSLGYVAAARPARPALFAAAFAVAAFPMFSNAFGIAFSGGGELIPSPSSTTQARDLRDIAVQTRADKGGQIVVHPDLADDITWPFRDSGDIVVASRPPDDASILIWPATAGPPQGFAPLAGEWTILDRPEAPLSGFLDFLHWFSHRNALENNPETVAVYVRGSQ